MKAKKKFSFLAFANASESDIRSGLLAGGFSVGWLLVGWGGEVGHGGRRRR